MARLRRFLPEQVADLIVAAGNGEALLQSHPPRGDRCLLRFARLYGLRRDSRVMTVWGSTIPVLANKLSARRELSSGSWATVSS